MDPKRLRLISGITLMVSAAASAYAATRALRRHIGRRKPGDHLRSDLRNTVEVSSALGRSSLVTHVGVREIHIALKPKDEGAKYEVVITAPDDDDGPAIRSVSTSVTARQESEAADQHRPDPNVRRYWFQRYRPGLGAVLLLLFCVVVMVIGIRAILIDRPGSLPASGQSADSFFLWLTSTRAFRNSTFAAETLLSPGASTWTATTKVDITTLNADAHGTVRVHVPDSATHPCFGVYDLRDRPDAAARPCVKLRRPSYSTLVHDSRFPNDYSLHLSARDFRVAVAGPVLRGRAYLGSFVLEYRIPRANLAFKLGTGSQLVAFDAGVLPIEAPNPVSPELWRTYHERHDDPAIAPLNASEGHGDDYRVTVQLPNGRRRFATVTPNPTSPTFRSRSWPVRLKTVHAEAEIVDDGARAWADDEKTLLFTVVGVILGLLPRLGKRHGKRQVAGAGTPPGRG